MDRCDYCAHRNGWDCGDGYRMCSPDILCPSFKLDFDTLPDKQKEAIQRRLNDEYLLDYR